jgi:monoamine oxidase
MAGDATLATPPSGPLQRRGKSQRVIILGAGLSGLVAGYELVSGGYDVTILEGNTRPGGRVFTLRDPLSDGHYAEAGAARIPVNHLWTLQYAKQFGLELEPFGPSEGASSYYLGGKVVRVTPQTDLRQYFNFSPAERQLGISGMVDKYIGEALREVATSGDPSVPDWPPAALLKYDQYNFADFLRSRGASPGFVRFVMMGAIPAEVSALVILRVLSTTDRDHLLRIVGGTDRLPKAFAAKLTRQIRYGARVVRIEQNATSVSAVVKEHGNLHTLHADRMICTLPFSVLRDIDVAPGFLIAQTTRDS